MMMKRSSSVLVIGALISVAVANAHAALVDVGNGLVNDTTQQLVWLKDANLAATETFGLARDTDLGTDPGDTSPVPVQGRIGSDGCMNWPAAMLWIDAMNRQKYKGYDDWRLPALTDTGDPGCDIASVGTDCGSNVDVATGELAHLWYGLGNIAFYDTNGIGPQPGYGLSNAGPFINMQHIFWYGTPYLPSPDGAWAFNAFDGTQLNLSKSSAVLRGWAVRSGQVDQTARPGTFALVAMLGLLGLVLFWWMRSRT
ncbi:MAG: DUF1566 domain-containing protein [Sphingobacteriia bacterium]|nr:DUF1566 domain-containing protein [Sphingobacteriia bacterium]NCC41243.1 DUF1566 domain-containing protein [Gammaproteobacteria bacterium]